MDASASIRCSCQCKRENANLADCVALYFKVVKSRRDTESADRLEDHVSLSYLTEHSSSSDAETEYVRYANGDDFAKDKTETAAAAATTATAATVTDVTKSNVFASTKYPSKTTAANGANSVTPTTTAAPSPATATGQPAIEAFTTG